MFSRPLLAAIALAATASAPALSQDFVGGWTGNGGPRVADSGPPALIVTLRRDARGGLTGEMSGGPLELEEVIRSGGAPYGAWIERGVLRGRAVSELDRWWFEGRLDGQTMRLWLVQVNDDYTVPAATAGLVYTLARGDRSPPGNPIPTATEAAREVAAAAAVESGRRAETARMSERARATATSVTGAWTAASPTGATITMTLRQEVNKEGEANQVSGTLVRDGVTYQFTGTSMSVAGLANVLLGGEARAGEATVEVEGEMSGRQLNVVLRVPRSRRRGVLGSTDSLTFVRR